LLAGCGSLQAEVANVLGQTLRCAVLLGFLGATSGQAQEQPEAKGLEARPPFKIGGFRYLYLPPKVEMNRPRTYMNICESATCTPGSKVSYVFFAPTPEPSFEQYQATRAMIADELKRRAAPGTTITFDPPQQTKDKIFTIFKTRRVEAFADGSKLFVLNQQVYSARMTVDMISSSPDEKAAEGNLALFTVPIMLLSQMQSGPPKDR
jgi:hypothetical protein